MEQLLTTKLSIPPLRTGLIPRPRLDLRLNEGSSRKLALVSAPAGFGKTTLVCDWTKQIKQPVAWLSLDKGDNDPARFLTYFIAALQTIESDIGQGGLDALQSPGGVNTEAVLTSLLNEIAGFADDMVLVLDDYHVIESQPIDQALTFLLDHLPVNLHLVIASRIDPSLHISRLRASGQMTEIRADDLRFTPDEAGAFLKQVIGFDLSAQEVAALEARTEGWIAGLQLAALSMEGLKQSSDIAGFISKFTGSDHYIQDYLTDEVLQQQPKSTKDFLLQTSILDRMSAPLCNAVTGFNDSQRILESLEASNLFIVALDNERRWYRYHHLFADLLQARLQRFHPGRLNSLHLRAADWFEENDLIDEAVEHAFSARNFDRAADLIEQAASGTMLYGRLTTILGWLDALPKVILDTRPRLRIYQAWSLAMAGQPVVADTILLDVRSSHKSLPNSPVTLALRGELAALRTGIIIHQNDPAEIIQEAEEALTFLPAENVISRSRVYMALGTAYAYSNEMHKAIETYERGRDLALKANAPFLATANIELITELLVYHQGRLKDAAENLAQILELGNAKDDNHQAFTGAAHVLLAEINLEWNNIEAAARYLEKGFELLRLGGIGYTLTHCYCAAARIKLAFGERDRTIEHLQSATRAAQASPLMHFQIRNLACQVKSALHLGDTITALRWAGGDYCDLPERLPTHLHEVQHISLARVYLAQSDLKKTIEILDRIHLGAKTAGRMAHVIDIYLLKALALHEGGESDAAIECLECSFSLAAAEGYIRTFVEYGEPMARLLREAAGRGIAPLYVNRLLSAFNASAYDASAFDAQDLGESLVHAAEQEGISRAVRSTSHPMEPLTDRELEVLHLMAEGMTYNEIADHIQVSLNTVRTHIKNLYSKLYVHKRSQAIAKARELNIL